MTDCQKCKYGITSECVPRSQKMGFPKCYQSVLTNYDRLISKTPEELAKAFAAIVAQKRPSTYTAEGFCLDDGEMSETDWLDWLKSPVEEE